MRIYTIEGGKIQEGATVASQLLSSGVTIPTVTVGEKGRGRKLSFIPVELLASTQAKLDQEGSAIILFCALGKTQKGAPKLIETQNDNDTDNDRCLVVLRTPIGFRGGNAHTGDRVEGSDPLEFLPFPCQILAEGQIAQGDAGRMGWGTQLVAVAPKGVVFRTSYTGRLYGRPSAHYYVYTGDRVLVATWEERVASELF
jgi:hypothetical protein